MPARAHNGRRSVSQPVATSGGIPSLVRGCVLQGLRGGSPMMLLPHTAALLDARADAQSLDSRSASATACGVDRLAQPQHLRQCKQDRTIARLRKRGNDAGRAKANPPPFNAAAISLQTPVPANPPSFFHLFDIVPSSYLLSGPSKRSLPGTATRPASHSLSHLSSNNAPHAKRRILLLGSTPL